MRNFLLALLHLAVVTAKLCGSVGVRAVMAENFLLKQQLIVLRCLLAKDRIDFLVGTTGNRVDERSSQLDDSVSTSSLSE